MQKTMSRANEKLKLLRAGETMLLKQRGHLERGSAQRAPPALRLAAAGGRGAAHKESPLPSSRKSCEWILYPRKGAKPQPPGCHEARQAPSAGHGPLAIARRVVVPPPSTPATGPGGIIGATSERARLPSSVCSLPRPYFEQQTMERKG